MKLTAALTRTSDLAEASSDARQKAAPEPSVSLEERSIEGADHDVEAPLRRRERENSRASVPRALASPASPSELVDL